MHKNFVIIFICVLTLGLVGGQELCDEPATSTSENTIDASDP